MAENSCKLLEVPNEVLAHVCSFLPPASLCRLEETSKIIKESLNIAGVWRICAKNSVKKGRSKYSFVMAMLEHAKVQSFKDAKVFKVIVGTSVVIEEMVQRVNDHVSFWSFTTEAALKRSGLLFKLCKIMFSNNTAIIQQ